MAVVIRMARFGKKKSPFYRVVATDKRYSRNGRYLEILGTFDPSDKDRKIKVEAERLKYWLEQGAQPSDTLKRLFKLNNVLAS